MCDEIARVPKYIAVETPTVVSKMLNVPKHNALSDMSSRLRRLRHDKSVSLRGGNSHSPQDEPRQRWLASATEIFSNPLLTITRELTLIYNWRAAHLSILL